MRMAGNIAAKSSICLQLRRYVHTPPQLPLDMLSITHKLTPTQIIDEEVLCVHGGLSPEIITLDQIRTIERNGEIPYKGAFCDLVWSDPEDMEYW